MESKLAKYVSVKECISCASGTDALLIPLMAENIGKGDAVFTTNFSYFATTEVISHLGATPIFIDIEQDTFNLNPNLLEIEIKKVIKEEKLVPKAIIAVDLFGHLADYSKISIIANKYNLLLIEDAAQSFGASYDNKKSCSYGHVSATSFFPAKPLGGYGDGGAIFTNDSKKADIYRSIRVHGQGIDKYDNIRVGLNSRLDTIQAAVLLNKLKIFDSELDLRNIVANYYSDKLYNSLIIPVVRNNYTSSWAQYSVLANDNKERKDLMRYLNNNKIPAVIYYRKPFNELDIYKNDLSDVYPVSKECSSRIFSIPMYPYLNRKNQDFIIDKIIKFYK